MTTIYFVRHVQAEGNIKAEFQGSRDTDISEQGALQCTNLSAFFKDKPLSTVYTSPLRRAVATAEAVADPGKAQLITEPRLREIDAGCWEGRKIAELEENDPVNFKVWTDTPHDFQVEGSESMREVFARVSASVRDIIAQNAGKTVAVVSHGCSLRSAIAAATGMNITQLTEIPWVRNAGVTRVNIPDGDATGTAVYHNETGHINPDTMLKTGTFYTTQGDAK